MVFQHLKGLLVDRLVQDEQSKRCGWFVGAEESSGIPFHR